MIIFWGMLEFLAKFGGNFPHFPKYMKILKLHHTATVHNIRAVHLLVLRCKGY